MQDLRAPECSSSSLSRGRLFRDSEARYILWGREGDNSCIKTTRLERSRAWAPSGLTTILGSCFVVRVKVAAAYRQAVTPQEDHTAGK